MNNHIQEFNRFITEQLNPDQRAAVTQQNGVLLVVAGAGSGKTRVITARIAHLMLNCGVRAHNIVALTFTNKAAHEMRERIVSYLPAGSALPFIGTFHAYCLRLLKEYKSLLKVPFESILDEDDQKKIVSSILERHNSTKKYSAKQILYQISHIKNRALNPHSEWQLLNNPFLETVYAAYELEKQASRCLDFDDLLLHAHTLITTQPVCGDRIRAQLQHILIDEYQDTNIVQHALLKALAKQDGITTAQSICVVGDEDQSIYSWRGATVDNMLHFKRDFVNTTMIKIEQNYRSVQPILSAANALIQHNRQRTPKELWSERTGNDRIRIVTCVSDHQEADVVAHTIATIRKQNSQRSIAILYRAHFQSRSLEEALVKNALPYVIIGGVQFYERKEIKDLISYLRLIVNPYDRTAFTRIINSPQRGLGTVFEEQFMELWRTEPLLDVHHIAQRMLDSAILTKSKKVTLHNWCALFEGLDAQSTPSACLERIINGTHYIAYIKESYDQQEAYERLQNIKELLDAAKYSELNGRPTVTAFLDDIALMQSAIQTNETAPDAITMMTLHAAKGLEFDCVILAGVEEGIMPSARSIAEDSNVEEERRLMYVGITRAREQLLITHCRYRYTYGNMNDQLPSRFIEEMQTMFTIPRAEAAYWNTQQIQTHALTWLNAPIKSAELVKKPIESKSVATLVTLVPNNNQTNLALYKTVKHNTFGIGTIQQLEERADGTWYVTARFKTGIKKVVSTFLTPL